MPNVHGMAGVVDDTIDGKDPSASNKMTGMKEENLEKATSSSPSKSKFHGVDDGFPGMKKEGKKSKDKGSY